MPNCEPVEPPETCIVCVEPEVLGWWNSICRRIPHLKFLSDGITWADDGRYSHNTLKRTNAAMDATLSDGVSIWYYYNLASLPRELGYYEYCVEPGDDPERDCPESSEALASVWDTIAGEVEIPVPLPEPVDGDAAAESDLPLSDDPPNFTIFGLLRLGVILLQKGRRLGRWLTNRSKDDPGYFCSELIAKGFAETEGIDLWVDVDPARIPRKAKAKTAIVDAMVARSEPFSPADSAAVSDTDELRERFRAQLDALAGVPLLAESTNIRIKVGYRDVNSTQKLFPPVLVTPNDLARSPSLKFFGSKCGSIPHDEHNTIDEELRRQRGRETRMILWGLPIALAVVVYLVFSGFTPLPGVRYIPLPAIGVLAVGGGTYAALCWRTEPPALPPE